MAGHDDEPDRLEKSGANTPDESVSAGAANSARARRRARRIQGPPQGAQSAPASGEVWAAPVDYPTATTPLGESVGTSAASPDQTTAATSTSSGGVAVLEHPATTANDGTDEHDADADASDESDGAAGKRRFSWLRRSKRFWFVGLVVVVILALLGTAGWFLWLRHDHNNLEAKRNAYMATATQEVLNTLNIHQDSADADVKRILDAASGSFFDQFNNSKGQFTEVVKQANVNSQGNVVQAALQDIQGNTAHVLVVGSSKVSNKASPQPTDRDYRLRVTVVDDGHRMTVSDMEYVIS